MSQRENDDNTELLSEREPIPDDEGGHEPPPEQATANTDDDFLAVDDAIDVLDEAIAAAPEDPGVPYEPEVLEAAATLKHEAPAEYARKQEGLREWVNMNEWPSAVKDTERDLQTRRQRQGDPRPVIMKHPDRAHEVINESIDALQDLDGLYERGGELVEIRDGEEGPEIQPVGKGRVYKLLAEAARYERPTKDGAKAIEPPRRIVHAVHDEGEWGLEKLEGFVDGAAFLEDGTILTTEGYHPDANLYLRHGVDMHGLRSPSRDDAVEARKRLVDLLVDFEFVEDERRAHESVWLASLLTMLARPAIGRKESTPLFLYDANQPGVGKTRLVEIACEIAMGRLPAPRPAPTGRNSDAEMRKTITGIARSGVPVVFFDNIKGRLGGGALELALTGKKWSSRILQKSEDWSGHLMLTWMATSNQASLTSDMRRRTLLCRIETDRESPERRSDFKYPRIQEHIREHRKTYLRDALTILRAWHVDGRPDQDLPAWGSFEAWSEIIRNAIVYAGGADPYATREGLIEADRETAQLRAVLEAWPEGLRLSSSEIGDALSQGWVRVDGVKKEDHPLLDALDTFLGTTNASSIGTQLGYVKKEPVAGQKLVNGTEHSKRYWTVVETDHA